MAKRRKAKPAPLDINSAINVMEGISSLNSQLLMQNKRVIIVDNAKDVPSPLPRITKDTLFNRDLAMLLKRRFNGFLVDIADTNSMDPWIDSGHGAIMIPFQDKAPFRKKDLVPGDVVMFDRKADGGKNILHRILSIDKDGAVLTRGDNAVWVDGRTKLDEIRYLCVGVIY